MLDELDVLLDRLAIGHLSQSSKRELFYRDIALARARSVLRWESDSSDYAVFETRLRLAIHLSPRSAIKYDRSNPRPRWKLIRRHLAEVFDRNSEEVDGLARDIAKLLDTFDSERSAVTSHLPYLLRTDGSRCRSCRADFFEISPCIDHRDEFKPYYLSPEELLQPEVDHKEAISALGGNDLDNLQLLCRFCNRGKGDGLGMNLREEIRYAGLPIDEIPRSHRGRLLYYVIQRDAGICSFCGTCETELTTRPIINSGGMVRSNLHSVCVRCAF